MRCLLCIKNDMEEMFRQTEADCERVEYWCTKCTGTYIRETKGGKTYYSSWSTH